MKLKGSILGCLLLALILLMAVPALADDANLERLPASNMEVTNAINYLDTVDFGRDITFFPLEEDRAMSRIAEEDLLHFDTLEEFEEFLRVFIAVMSDEGIENKAYMNKLEEMGMNFAPMSTRVHQVHSEWRPNLLFGITHGQSIGFSFVRNGNTVTNLRVDDSWPTGVLIAISWTHRSGNASVSFNNPAQRQTVVTLSANGTWRVGAQIGGMTIGSVWDDSWNNRNAIINH